MSQERDPKTVSEAPNHRASPQRRRTVIVEDHPAYADMIGVALERSGWFEVVGAPADPDEAIELIKRERPQLAVIDVRLPRGSEGVIVAQEAKKNFPEMTIVILTGSDDPQHVRNAMPVPVDGYLSKSIRTEHLAPALLCACSGLTVLSKSAFETTLEEKPATPCPLSQDELLALKLSAEDLSFREIGTNLYVSPAKVHRIFEDIKQELGVEGLKQAIVVAAKNSWI